MAWPSSLRARLALWYTVLLGLPLIGFAIASYFLFARTLQRRSDDFFGDALSAFTRELAAERRAALGAAAAMRSTVEEVRFRDFRIAILDSSGAVLTETMPAAGDPAQQARLWGAAGREALGALRGHPLDRPLALSVPAGAPAFRVLARPLPVEGQHFVLTGTYSLGDTLALLARLRGIFALAIPLLLLCAGTGGYFLAKRSLAPVASMAGQAAKISASNLDERLPVGGGAELVGLARVVNDLLDRLERSFAQQRSFVTDASHELRTPAAILRTEAEVTLSREHRAESEYRASVAVMQDAARRLTRIVDDLFLLARADSGDLVAHREAVYLEDLVHDTARAVHSVAERRGVQVALGELVEAPFRGDPDLLGRLLLNLLDNAIKYSPAGGTVAVGMRRANGSCEIAVVDGGPGIPAEARERVFERFYRVERSRSRAEQSATSGAGLGLAIARRIAELHAGRLELAESRPGRTEFRLTLPVEETPA